jgi:glycogen debranching enzyme
MDQQSFTARCRKVLNDAARPGGCFAATFGPTFLDQTDPRYEPTVYWRGATWPQLNYLIALAASRHGDVDLAHQIGTATKSAVSANGFAEFWDPRNASAGIGAAVPQTWSAIAVAMPGNPPD